MHKVYLHKGFLVCPNWEGTEKEYFHILDLKGAVENAHCITGFRNETNINTLEDAEIFIDKYEISKRPKPTDD